MVSASKVLSKQAILLLDTRKIFCDNPKCSHKTFSERFEFISPNEKKRNVLDAVKNSIKYEYNNGLAEGSVNKIKLAKRIMYGRNSFLLLKAKLLLNEKFHQIN